MLRTSDRRRSEKFARGKVRGYSRGYSHRPNTKNAIATTVTVINAASNVATNANTTILYPASDRSFRASRSRTTMWRFLSSTAPPSSSLRKARVTATRLQPIIEAS